MKKCTVEGGKFVQACDLLKRNTEQDQPVGKRKGIFLGIYQADQPVRRARFMVLSPVKWYQLEWLSIFARFAVQTSARRLLKNKEKWHV